MHPLGCATCNTLPRSGNDGRNKRATTRPEGLGTGYSCATAPATFSQHHPWRLCNRPEAMDSKKLHAGVDHRGGSAPRYLPLVSQSYGRGPHHGLHVTKAPRLRSSALPRLVNCGTGFGQVAEVGRHIEKAHGCRVRYLVRLQEVVGDAPIEFALGVGVLRR